MLSYNIHNYLKYFYLRYIKRIDTPAKFIHFFAKRHAHKIVIEENERTYTMEQLNKRVNSLASSLMKLGLQKGDIIGLNLDNSIEYIELRLAAYKTGLVFCALIDDFSTEQVLHKIRIMRFNAFFCQDMALADAILNLPDIDIPECLVCTQKNEMSGKVLIYENLIHEGIIAEPDDITKPEDISAIGFTSGTTGESKAVIWSHRAWLQSFYHFLLNTRLIEGEMCMLQFIPLSTAGSLIILPWLASGGKIILRKSYAAKEVSEIITGKKITHLVTAPVFLVDLWDYYMANRNKYDFSSLKSISVGSAPLSGSKLKQMIDTFGPIIQQSYGMAEVLAPLASLKIMDPEQDEDMLTSVGIPIKQVQIRLAEKDAMGNGKIKIFSNTGCLGYWTPDGIDRSCFQNRWFMTDDLGSFDKAGNLFILERKSRLIDHNGQVIMPRDIEEVIHSFAGIKDVVVNNSGRELKAYYTPCRNHTIDPVKLKKYCLQKLPKDQIPDAFVLIQEMPRSTSGKFLSIPM